MLHKTPSTKIVPVELELPPLPGEAEQALAADAAPVAVPVVESPDGSMEQHLGDILKQLGSLLTAQEAQGGKIDVALLAQEALQRWMGDAKLVIEQRNVVNKAMFEALHAELKGYKDGFLMEALQRPIIRDLISIYDDASDLLRQLKASVMMQESRGGVSGVAIVLLENVSNVCVNMEHNIGFVIEVLERMDVTMMPTNTGKLDKQRQRANSIEPTNDPDLDQMVVKVLKRGFQWKDRVVRPEEVVIKKWAANIELLAQVPKAPASSITRAVGN